jgi:hypothetical protein
LTPNPTQEKKNSSSRHPHSINNAMPFDGPNPANLFHEITCLVGNDGELREFYSGGAAARGDVAWFLASSGHHCVLGKCYSLIPVMPELCSNTVAA